MEKKNTTYMELAYMLKEAGLDIDIEECEKIDQIDREYERKLEENKKTKTQKIHNTL